MQTGASQRDLQLQVFALPVDVYTVVDGKTLMAGDKPLRISADGIAADKDVEWFFYVPF